MQTPSTNSVSSRKKLISWLAGGLIFVLMLITVEALVGWNTVLAQWKSVPLSTLIPALLLFALSYLLRAIRIYDLCQPALKGRLLSVTKLSVLHLYANNMLPMRLGEGLFPILMKRYFGVGIGESIARLIWLRVLDLLIAGALLTVTFGYFFPLFSIVAFCAGVSCLLAAIALYRFKGRRWMQSQALYPKVDPVINKLRITAPQSMKQFIRVVVWTFLSWGSKLAALVMVTQALQSFSIFEALAGVLGAELSSILPIHGIAGSGSFEAAFMAGLAPLGLLSSEILGLAVNLHLFILGATSLFALICFWIPVAKVTREEITK